jgi:hypothetical protein
VVQLLLAIWPTNPSINQGNFFNSEKDQGQLRKFKRFNPILANNAAADGKLVS